MQPENSSIPQQFVAPKPKKSRPWALMFISIVLLCAVGALGYYLKSEIEAHRTTSKQLTEQTNIIHENTQTIRDARLEPSFRKVLQDNANRDCSSNSAVLFNTTTSIEKNLDGTAKKYFAVGQYVCNNGGVALGGPIRFASAQSVNAITWDFTYGSSTLEPTSLPSYIFNTDPALFNRKYNNPKVF